MDRPEIEEPPTASLALPLAILQLFALAGVAALATGHGSVLLMASLVAPLLARCRTAFRQQSAFWLLRPDVVVLFSLVIYFVPSALDVEFGSNIRRVSHENLLQYLLLANLFAFAFFWATRSIDSSIAASLGEGQGTPAAPDFPGLVRFVAVSAIVCGALVYLYFTLTTLGGLRGLLSMSRADYYSHLRDNGFYAAGLTLLRTGWLLLFAVDCLQGRRRLVWHLFPLLLFCLFFLAAGERSVWVRLFAGMAFLLFWARRFSPKVIAALALVGIIGLHLFSNVRYALDRPGVSLWQAAMKSESWFDFSRGELGAHYFVANDVLGDPELSRTRLGATYIGAVPNLIPLKIWPRRSDYVISPEREHIAKFFPERPASFGMGYSFVVESFINFWLLGPLLVGFVLGRGVSWVYRRVISGKGSLLWKAAYAASLPVLLLLPRMSFAGVLKALTISTVIPFGVLLLALWLVRPRRRLSDARPHPTSQA